MLHFHGLELYLVISLIYSWPFAALLMQVIRDERYNKMKVTEITRQADEMVQKNVALSPCRNRHSMVCQNDEQKCFSLVGCSNLKGIIDIDCYSYLVSATHIIHRQCRHCI